jgi:hypothetical protein
MMRKLACRVVVLFMLVNQAANGDQPAASLSIPDEIDLTGGVRTGFSNGGLAFDSGMSAIRSNPAMIAMDKTYLISGGYHWPSVGSDYYQVGVIDSKTSEVAAGISLIRPTEDFKAVSKRARLNEVVHPLKNRVSVAFGFSLQRLALGISGQLVEAFEFQEQSETQEKIRGNTLGFGVAGLLTPSIRFAASVENLANRNVEFIAPRFYRAGLAYAHDSGLFSIHADYVSRAAIVDSDSAFFTQRLRSFGLKADPTTDVKSAELQQQFIGSFSARAYDLLRILGGYGNNIESGSQSFGGGVALVKDAWTFSYVAMRPNTESPTAHQAASLEVNISL